MESLNKKQKKKKFNRAKIAYGIYVASLLISISSLGICLQLSNENTLLNEKIYELANATNYDLDKHEAKKTQEEIEEKSSLFEQMDYFKNNNLPSSTTKSDLWKVSDSDEYYVLMYMDSCSHCEELETYFYENMPFLEKKEVYFLNVQTASEEQGFVWSADVAKETKYTISKEKLELEGTPMMVKVKRNSNSLNVYLGGESILKELNIN